MLPGNDGLRSGSERDVCRVERSRVSPRVPAGLLLGLLAFREGWAVCRFPNPLAALPSVLASLALGACLWWVAHRQVGWRGALVALALFALSPVGTPGAPAFLEAPAALGLFAMLYTAVGVAHTLQGPRRKWPPRMVMMALLSAYTAWLDPLAALEALVLSAVAMLYLAEDRRRFVVPLLLGWGAAAGTAGLLRSNLSAVLPGRLPVAPLLPFVVRPSSYLLGPLHANAGVLLAVVCGLSLWAISRRTRYFGNTAPLAAVAGFVLFDVMVSRKMTVLNGCTLPFALLFVAGTCADGFETRGKRFWQVAAAFSIVVQLAAALGR